MVQRITVEELDVFSDQQLLYRPIWRKCQHGLLLFQPAVAGSAVDCLVLTTVGYLVEPAEAFTISGFNVQHDAGRSEPRHQRDIKALSGVAHPVFSFALCLCPERPAQARYEAHFFGELPEGKIEAMLTRLISITLQHNRLHVVIQHFLWHAAEEPKGVAVTAFHRFVSQIVCELDVKHPAVSQYGNKDVKRSVSTAHRPLIDLHLSSPLGFNADSLLSGCRGMLCTVEVTQQRQGAR